MGGDSIETSALGPETSEGAEAVFEPDHRGAEDPFADGEDMGVVDEQGNVTAVIPGSQTRSASNDGLPSSGSSGSIEQDRKEMNRANTQWSQSNANRARDLDAREAQLNAHLNTIQSQPQQLPPAVTADGLVANLPSHLQGLDAGAREVLEYIDTSQRARADKGNEQFSQVQQTVQTLATTVQAIQQQAQNVQTENEWNGVVAKHGQRAANHYMSGVAHMMTTHPGLGPEAAFNSVAAQYLQQQAVRDYQSGQNRGNQLRQNASAFEGAGTAPSGDPVVQYVAGESMAATMAKLGHSQG